MILGMTPLVLIHTLISLAIVALRRFHPQG